METQIAEDFVSFETAKLLKEKGFDVITEKCYILDNTGLCAVKIGQIFNGSPQGKHEIAAPTLQMAVKWLRKKGFYINCTISYDSTYDEDGDEVDRRTFWIYEILSSNSGGLIYSEEEREFSTYEEAVETAIKYCLLNF